ncbi:DUF3135 domain-containing protein [Aquisalimonas sp.]|uniref:DUF3135 domain-containing protein n=1 Tax=Aquisalimonas sp. TaxID=1872621 RepID=UPI0025C21896|nr:DUF3135 domain-containing protein [Aquisalimonas sp.]
MTYPSFDEWRELAVRDPAAFEARRRAVIAAAIAAAPPERRERLQRLQWRIDRVRSRDSDPLVACMRLSRMMWDSVYSERGLLAQLEYLGKRWTGRTTSGLPQAQILPFKKR